MRQLSSVPNPVLKLVLVLVLVGSGFWVYHNWQATLQAQARLAQAHSQFSVLKKWLYKAKQHGAEYYADRSFLADVPDMDWQQWLTEQGQLAGSQLLNWRIDADQLHITWQVHDLGQALEIGQAMHKQWAFSLHQWQIDTHKDSQQLIVQMGYQIDVP